MDATALDELTDKLAVAVRDQWNAAAAERGLREPTTLPVRWRLRPDPVAEPSGVSFDPLPGIDPVTPGQLREGTQRALHRVYGGLVSGRLVITGGPGTGKSSAAILLLLDALRYRDQAPSDHRARIPVPVLCTPQGWDPATTSVYDWLATTFAPLVRGRRKAAELLASDRIAVILDGLDDLPEAVRPAALLALSRQAGFRLVLLTRTAEPIAGAAALELRPLTPTDAATYVQHSFTDPVPPPWQRLITTLQNDIHNPTARALTSPLTVTLLRDAYPANAPIEELLDATRFTQPDDVTRHLLDRAVTAAYAPRPGQRPARYTSETAHHTLTFIARRLRDGNTRAFAWRTTITWVPRTHRVLLGALPFGLAAGLVAGFVVSGLVPMLLVGGLVTGVLLGMEVWMAVVSQVYLRWKHDTPLRLGHFLDDARTRRLLHAVGPAYQFRHATLQDRLAPP